MEPDESKRVRLSGGPEDSSSYAVIREDGRLVIETYDFAEDSLGNRVVNGAFFLFFDCAAKGKMLELLEKDAPVSRSRGDEDVSLLRLLEKCFTGYFQVKQWCESNAIPYRKEVDDW
jgi:hypothetical protein